MRIRKRYLKHRAAVLPWTQPSRAPPTLDLNIPAAADDEREEELHSDGSLIPNAFQGSPATKESVEEDLSRRIDAKESENEGDESRCAEGIGLKNFVVGGSSEKTYRQDEEDKRLSERRRNSETRRSKTAADEEKVEKDSNLETGKQRRRPDIMTEGSRCTRVGGRGWKCSKQTRDGYRLCEQHRNGKKAGMIKRKEDWEAEDSTRNKKRKVEMKDA